jgi:DNA-directed RNA polymerase specialized sigma24 family protein
MVRTPQVAHRAQGRWLRLLLMHLAGRQVRARVELEDLSQEVYVRAIAHTDSRALSTASPTKTRGRSDG